MIALGAFVALMILTHELIVWDEAHPRNKVTFPQRYAPEFEDDV